MEQGKTMGEALTPGTILLGRYRINALLGQGGFGITYVADDLLGQRPVALKELFPAGYVSRSSDGSTLSILHGMEDAVAHLKKSFEDEARILMLLQGCSGIIQVSHLFSENNTAYYVMELLVGQDLSHRLRTAGVMTWQQFSPIFHSLLDALEQIHKAGLIHRDVTPDNIFLTRQGEVRLIDFGSVRSYQGSDHFTALIKHSFAPWEQYLTKGNQGPWTDIYALCVTAYYSLSGKCPPRATERRMEDTIIPLKTLCPGLPEQICRVLHKGMAVMAEDRYSSIAQLRAALDGHAAPVMTRLACLKGVMAGKSWTIPPETALRVGRSGDCEIRYPTGTAGVSRHHCTFFRSREGTLMVRDDGSSWGTCLVGRGGTMALPAGRWHVLGENRVCFGGQEEYVEAAL